MNRASKTNAISEVREFLSDFPPNANSSKAVFRSRQYCGKRKGAEKLKYRLYIRHRIMRISISQWIRIRGSGEAHFVYEICESVWLLIIIIILIINKFIYNFTELDSHIRTYSTYNHITYKAIKCDATWYATWYIQIVYISLVITFLHI